MSMMLMVQALKAKVGSPLRKLVLVKLADQANDDGECWPSYQSIAEACEMSRRTVISHIEWLEENGFLRRNYRKSKEGLNRSNVFVLTIESGANAAPQGANNSPRGANAAPPSGENFAPGGANAAPIETVNESISFESVNESGGAPTRDSAPREPSPPAPPPHAKPKRQSREEAFVAFVVERGVDEETARCWWQYRDGKPMTSKAWERHCAQADAAGISPQAAADYTAGREWRAFYADGYLREMADTELARRQSAPQGRVFDQAGNPRGGMVAAGMPATFGGASMPAGRTSKMSQGLAALEELKAKIDRGEI